MSLPLHQICMESLVSAALLRAVLWWFIGHALKTKQWQKLEIETDKNRRCNTQTFSSFTWKNKAQKVTANASFHAQKLTQFRRNSLVSLGREQCTCQSFYKSLNYFILNQLVPACRREPAPAPKLYQSMRFLRFCYSTIQNSCKQLSFHFPTKM